MKKLDILILASISSLASAQASTISWTVSDITGQASDISNNGTLVSAQGDSSLDQDITVGGVTFADAQIPYSSGASFFNEFRAVSLPPDADADYQTLLEHSTRNNAATSVITYAGLTEGQQYEIQLWTADDRADTALVLSDGEGDATVDAPGAVTLLQGNTENSNAGQYAIGIFTADASGEQSFRLQRYRNFSTAPGTTGNAIVNAIQLREISGSATVALTLSGLSYNPETGESEVSLKGQPSSAYFLVEADDLDFTDPDQSPISLTGATVGTLDGNQVTTDANGDATVQFNLGATKAASFVRAEIATRLP